MKGLVLYALLEAFVLDFGMHLLSYAVGLITGYPPFAVSGAEEREYGSSGVQEKRWRK